MPKIILEFNLPEEEEEFKVAKYGSQLHAALTGAKEKIFWQADEADITYPKKQAFQEAFNIIMDELDAYDIKHLFS